MAEENKQFAFEISLSVLNHLGRNLYRNFVTVLGEAISNSWDADANNVWIYIDRDNSNFVIKDDGDGMTPGDFQNKFLKVGYSKRKENGPSSPNKRPYIGAKGIGKLALLSCAEKISVISKTEKTEYTGGLIDNSDLNDAIEHDLTPDKYQLGQVNFELFKEYVSGHQKGTIVYFEQTKEEIRNTIPHIKKLVALYFRFSLVDKNFNIFVNDEIVSFEDLKDLSESTEFVWKINNINDPYIDTLTKIKNPPIDITSNLKMVGFIGTVEKPRFLKIAGTEEKVGIDLFVNGRLRERDILRHASDFATRHIASYLYGQIHFDQLDQDGVDRFTSSREGVISGDNKYNELLEVLKTEIFDTISNKWDELRLSRGEDGDDDNPRKSLEQRRALSLYNLSSKDYTGSGNPDVDAWIKRLQPDAEFNIPSYVACFLSENLVREYIRSKNIPLTAPATNEINEWKPREELRKSEANISFEIREGGDDLSYLGMDFLAKVVDGGNAGQNVSSLIRDAVEYKPMRNAVGHTALLTGDAKSRLNLVYQNIKARVKNLLSGSS